MMGSDKELMSVETIGLAEMVGVVSIGFAKMAGVVSSIAVLILAGILGKEGVEGSI